ncbi:MAG TPA: class II fructose-bisphosphatase [bacterium]|jgi:fructose-1,6-bisphosphatase II|nr:class II fructose-bisphosphatase [bacterium]
MGRQRMVGTVIYLLSEDGELVLGEEVNVALDRELALELVRVTEAAAIASGRWMGRGEREAADQAAVTAMRTVFDSINIDGTVVIGEGELDQAPMLYIGERVGNGNPPKVDVAVDPLEGTNILAKGLPNAIAVVAVAEEGCFLHAPDVYMEKLAVGKWAKGKIDLDAPVIDNLAAVAHGTGKNIGDLVVVVLDRPRNADLIAGIKAAGARLQLISDGDVAPAIAAGIDEEAPDMVWGIGGAPEGVLSAAALKCLGGEMQARLRPMSEHERQRCRQMGIDKIDRLLPMEELVCGDEVMCAVTGITAGDLLEGVHYRGKEVRTSSLVLRATTGTVRFIRAIHDMSRKLGDGEAGR